VSRAVRSAALLATAALLAVPVVATAQPAVPRAAQTVLPTGAVAVINGQQVHGMVLNTPGANPLSAVPTLERLRTDGVNLVSIYIPWEIHNSFSSDLHSTKETPSDNTLKVLSLLAHQHGLAVEWMPLVTPAGNAPRYNILPNNMSQWWTKYTAMIDRYAKLAAGANVEIFSIGSELTALQKFTSNWLTIISHVRNQDGYHGKTTYMSTTGDSPPFPDLGWWGNVDLLSVSPYWSLSPAKVPLVANLAASWRNQYLPLLKNLSQTYGKPVLMDEIGYANQDFAAYRPAVAWQNHNAHPNQQAQANAYEALLQVSTAPQQQSWLAGVVWFYWGSTKTQPNKDTGYSPQGKQAECVVAKYWAPRTAPGSKPLGNIASACVATHVA
jgi:hypothetical protein